MLFSVMLIILMLPLQQKKLIETEMANESSMGERRSSLVSDRWSTSTEETPGSMNRPASGANEAVRFTISKKETTNPLTADV